jgi:hypothetical protein
MLKESPPQGNAYHRRGSQVKGKGEEKKVLRCCSAAVLQFNPIG